jgi:hypothetical protein
MKFGNRDRWIKYAHALIVCAAASALFLARNSAPHFPRPHSVQTVRVDAHHDQRPRFDTGSRCCWAKRAFVVWPPTELRAHFTPPTEFLLSFETRGAHYNRPPPHSFL